MSDLLSAAYQLRAIAAGMVGSLLILTDRELRDADREELREFALSCRVAIAAVQVPGSN
uniref:hypothetical protein n=1 Tax=Paractinoplanes polyasparticus TaxID=2856853 RepID=UPI001C85DFE6|nr:hypothetical protein [Actinoplanes polyasparticus]